MPLRFIFLLLSFFPVAVYSQKGLTRFELKPGDLGSNPYDFTVAMGKLFFTASVDTLWNQMWFVDGDQAPKRLTTYPVPLGYKPIIGTVDNKLYFAVQENGADLTEKIYVYDGNTPPHLLLDIAPGDTAMKIWGGAIYNGKIYFTAWTKSYQYAIWSLDPKTNQAQVEYIPPNYTNILDLNVLHDKLFFRQSTAAYGNELYSFDLITLKDTVYDINPGPASTFVTDMHLIDDRIYYRGLDPTHGNELFMCDGRNFPICITDIMPGNDDGVYVPSPVGLNGKVYFIGAMASPANQNATGLYRYDTATGNVTLENNLLPTYNTIIQELIVYNGKIYFTAADSTGLGQELAVYDFIDPPHVVVDGMKPGSTYPMDFHRYNDYLFFKGSDVYAGWELFRYIDPVLDVHMYNIENNLTTYPNPAVQEISITLKQPAATIVNIEIVNMAGIQIYHQDGILATAGSYTHHIPVTTLVPGFYCCIVRGRDGSVHKTRFIKE